MTAPVSADDGGAASTDETSLVSEEQIDYSGDALGAGVGRLSPGRGAPRPMLRLSAAPEPLPEARQAARGPGAPPDPLTIYRAALETLRAGHQVEALAGFRRFLDGNPRHDYADNAQYWIGECYYDLRQLRAAEREFRRVIDRYPRGNKVPDAMLKLGFTLQAEGDDVGGRQVLESLARAFPKHEAARFASFRLAHPEPDAAGGPRAGETPTLGTVLPPPVGGVARP